jgi:hypothetical protein
MSGLRKLAKIVFFLATCGLLLNGLGHIDLASWGVNSEWREKIEMVLQAKEILSETVEIIPWGKALSERSTEIQLAAATPGLILVLIEVLSSLLRFLILVAVLAAVVGLAFVYVPGLLAQRPSSPQASPQIVPSSPTPWPVPIPIWPGHQGIPQLPHRR